MKRFFFIVFAFAFPVLTQSAFALQIRDTVKTDSLPYLKARQSYYNLYVAADTKLASDSTIANLKQSLSALQEVIDVDDNIIKEYASIHSSSLVADTLINKLIKENQSLATDYNKQKDKFLWLVVIAAVLNVFLIVFIILYLKRTRKAAHLRKELRTTKEDTSVLKEEHAALKVNSEQEIVKLRSIEAEMLKEKIELTTALENFIKKEKEGGSQNEILKKESDAKLVLLKTELNNITQEKIKIQNELNDAKKSTGISLQDKEKFEKEISFLRTSIDIEKASKRKLEEEIKQLKTQVSSAPAEDSTQKDKQITDLESRLKSAEFKVQLFTEKNAQLSNEINVLKSSIPSTVDTDANAAKDARISELEAKLADTEAARSLIEQELKTFFEQMKNFRK